MLHSFSAIVGRGAGGLANGYRFHTCLVCTRVYHGVSVTTFLRIWSSCDCQQSIRQRVKSNPLRRHGRHGKDGSQQLAYSFIDQEGVGWVLLFL